MDEREEDDTGAAGGKWGKGGRSERVLRSKGKRCYNEGKQGKRVYESGNGLRITSIVTTALE